MYTTDIVISLHPVNPEISIIKLRGGLTAAAESTLLDSYDRASDAGARVILLGFDGLTYMNSAGIGLLVRLVIRAQRQAQQVLAYGLQDPFRRIFELTRLREVIRVYATEEEALGVSGVA